MSIKMTKKGNAKWNGVKYKAVPRATCEGCAFYAPSIYCGSVHCAAEDRGSIDYTHRRVPVIFVKKENSNETNP